LFVVSQTQAEYMPVSEQNRNKSTSAAIADNDFEFSNGPEGPDGPGGTENFTIN
jgi:hypothetical protein